MTGESNSICSYSILEILLMTFDRKPTPVGSTIRYSGEIVFAIVRIFIAKSALPLQQMHFSVNSHTLRPVSSLMISLSIFIEAYSFSRITKSLFNLFDNVLINVVFPAPRNPETINTFMNMPLFTSKLKSPAWRAVISTLEKPGILLSICLCSQPV